MAQIPPCLPSSRLAARRDRRQRGSAFVVTLFALLILTSVGLALAFVTQNELLLGSNERTIQRVFYAAEAGIAVATARVLWNQDMSATTFSFDEARAVQGQDIIALRDDVQVTRVLPINDQICDLCQINRPAQFFKIQHALTSTAIREGLAPVGGNEEDAVPLAQGRVSVTLNLQPWQRSPSALARNEEELAQIKQ